MRTTIASILLLVFSAIAKAGQTPNGLWEGTWTKQGDPLPITVEFRQAKGIWSGSFSSGDLGVADIPFRNISVDGDRLRWDVVGDFTTSHFETTLRQSRLSGTMSESPNRPSSEDQVVKGTIELRRIMESARPYRTESVAFKSGDVSLAGSLLVPRGHSRRPALILVPGSGPQVRYSMMYIADYLARHGIEALIYDKRGTGQSSGDWRQAGYEDLAADASAAIAFLRTRLEVDPRRVGYFGHSQGAMLAPLVAQRSKLNFVIAADGFGGTQSEQDLARVSNLLAESEFSKEDRKAAFDVYKRFVAVAASGEQAKRTAFREYTKNLTDKPWYQWLAIPGDDSYWWNLYPKTAGYSCLDYWPKVRAPILLIHGAEDRTCPLHPGLDRIVDSLRAGRRNYKVIVVKDADHTLRLPVRKGKSWPHIAPGFLSAVNRFIQESRTR